MSRVRAGNLPVPSARSNTNDKITTIVMMMVLRDIVIVVIISYTYKKLKRLVDYTSHEQKHAMTYLDYYE